MNTKTISKMLKISKAVLYSASAAPFVMRILDAAGVEVDRDVKFYVDVMAPVAAGMAGLAYGTLKGNAQVHADTKFLLNHPEYYILTSCKEGDVVSISTEGLTNNLEELIKDVKANTHNVIASRKI